MKNSYLTARVTCYGDAIHATRSGGSLGTLDDVGTKKIGSPADTAVNTDAGFAGSTTGN